MYALGDDETIVSSPTLWGSGTRLEVEKEEGEDNLLQGTLPTSSLVHPHVRGVNWKCSYGVANKGKNETVLVFDLGGGTFDITVMKKRLLQKRSRYQEMYANDLLSLEELKEKLAGVTEELKAVDLNLEKLALATQLRSSAGEITRYYRREIERFLALETVSNVDMRRLIDHITVSRDGNVHVVLRKFEEMP